MHLKKKHNRFCGYIAILLPCVVNSAPPLEPPPTFNEPMVTIAPIALANNDLRPDGTTAYRPWFENGAWQGDLIELSINPSGIITSDVVLDTSPPTSTNGNNWSARIQFEAAASANTEFWDTDRLIIIGSDQNRNSATPFRWGALTTSQRQAIDQEASNNNATSSNILNFLRGERSNERTPGATNTDDSATNTLRRRLSILGDIIHSPPRFVGPPNQDFNFDNYAAFASANQNRLPRVYVGSNDGMLHAFDAETGNEVFAFIPSMVVNNLSRLAVSPYQHTYFVDGQLATADVNFSAPNLDNSNITNPPDWRTVLVGGLGAGGKGFYALDITNTDTSGANENSENDIARRFFLWETDATDRDIGYSYSRPTITRLNDGNWYAIVGNGYESQNGNAVLLIIDINTGNIVERIDATNGGANGLSSPSLIDNDNDGLADFAYAGDLDGNLWKFDLTSELPSNWDVALAGNPLLELNDSQPIVAPPDIANDGANGVFVYIGTGRAFSLLDLSTNSRQALYGVIDEDNPDLQFPILDNSQDRRTQLFNPSQFQDGETILDVRTGTNAVTPGQFRFWKINNVPNGELFLTQPQTRAGRVQVSSYNHPNTPNDPASNWFTQPSFIDGSRPLMTIFDSNGNGALDDSDNVNGSANEESIVMGINLGDGIRSRATIAVVSDDTDTALINGLFVPEFGTCPERFADICFGAFTDPDEFNTEFQELVNEINTELANLGDEPIGSGSFFNDDSTFNTEAISEALDELQTTSDTLTTLVDDTREAINFIGNAQEDITSSRSTTEVNGRLTGSVQNLENLGPSYGLGRRSWVELSQ